MKTSKDSLRSLVVMAAAAAARYLDQSDRKVLDALRPATPSLSAAVPSPQAILTSALKSLSLTRAYRSGTLTPRQRLALLHAVRVVARAWLRGFATAFLDAVRPPEPAAMAAFAGVRETSSSFFKKVGQYVKNALVAGALSLFGPDPLDRAALAAIDAHHAVQVGFLDGFEQELADDEQDLDGTIISRSELYGGAVWSATQNLVALRMRDGDYDEACRIHGGIDNPCGVCEAEEAKGWQPIEELVGIGQSPCGNNCHCYVLYRSSSDPEGTEYYGWE
jgi:hypothetical protein